MGQADGVAVPVASRRLPVVALLATNAVSLLGTQLTAVALPWFVLQTTGSAARTGLVAFAEAAGFLLAGFLAGPLVDRRGYKAVSVGSDLASAAAVGAVPLLHHTVGLAFWQLVALAFAAAVLQSPGQAARARIVPELGALAGVRLERVTAASEATYQVTLLVGPVVSGLLIAALGPADVLAADAASYACSALLVALAIPPGLLPPPDHASGGAGGGLARYLADLIAGWRFLRDDGLLVPLTLSFALAIALVNAPLFGVVLPVYAAQGLGSAAGLGLLFSVFALGALGGAAVFGAVGGRVSWRRLWVARFGLIALPYAALAAGLGWPAALLALAACGAANGATNPLLATVRFRRTPAALRGRVFGPMRLVGDVAVPLGVLLAGVAVEALGLRVAALGLALATAAVGLAVLAAPAFRLLDLTGASPPAP